MASIIAKSGHVVGDLACQRDSYLQTLDSEVISCVELPPVQNSSKGKTKASTDPLKNGSPSVGSKIWQIEFADSVLFPEGGGQPSDHGFVVKLTEPPSKPIPINFVQRQGLRCVYHSPEPLELGSRVRQDVAFTRRWDHMQQHTGQHLLSAIMDTYDNLETLGWGMGTEGNANYVDLPRKPSDKEVQEIQDKCNEAIRSNHPISVETPEEASGESLPGDYDREKGVVRVIKIGNIDANPCCGTHLSQTSHIQLILITSSQWISAPKRLRLSFIAGNRAIELATTSISSLRSVASIISSPPSPEEIIATARRITEVCAASRKNEIKLLGEVAKYEAERVKDILAQGKKAWVYRSTGGLEFINMVLFEIKDALKEGGLVVLASSEVNETGAVVVTGIPALVEDFVRKLKDTVASIKGGGKGEKWQGKVVVWRKGEVEALRKLVEI